MFGAIISGLSSIAGGFLNKQAQDKQTGMQKQFAKHGIQWRVEDAKRSGIHPLYALGANTHSFSPVSVGGGLGDGISQAGQQIGGAIDRMADPDQRFTRKLQALAVQRGELENQVLASQLARERVNATPGLPGHSYLIDGQGNTVQVGEERKHPQRTMTLRTPEGIIITDPRASDQQAFEDRYGEIGGEIFGLRNLYNEYVGPWFRKKNRELDEMDPKRRNW